MGLLIRQDFTDTTYRVPLDEIDYFLLLDGHLESQFQNADNVIKLYGSFSCYLHYADFLRDIKYMETSVPILTEHRPSTLEDSLHRILVPVDSDDSDIESIQYI